jgi:hypothetical protein
VAFVQHDGGFLNDFGLPGVWHQPCSCGAMSLLTIILVIVVVGVLLWAINSFIPMDSKIKSILNIVVVIALILWLLQAFGILGSLSGVRVG